MAIKVPCVSCGKTLTAPDNAAGRRARCPSCGTVQTLPAPQALEPEPLEPEPIHDAPPAGDPNDPFSGLGSPSEPYALNEPPPVTPPPLPGGGGGGMGGDARKPCPMCGEMIPQAAMKCRFCGTIFDPKLRKQEAKRGKSYDAGDEDLSAGEWLVAILCSGIGCILGTVWMLQGKPKGKKMFFVSLAAGVVWNVISAAVKSTR